MMKRMLVTAAMLSAAIAAPAASQSASRISIEPYVGYGFFGELPAAEEANEVNLEGDLAYGGRVAYQFSEQWAVFGNFQRSTPSIEGTEADVTVDHWAAGAEFSYVPRGGAEGMLPVILEAGLGQARYDFEGSSNSDLAVKLGISSALQLSPNFGVRYGVDDYISNFDDEGIVNQIFARVGVELSL